MNIEEIKPVNVVEDLKQQLKECEQKLKEESEEREKWKSSYFSEFSEKIFYKNAFEALVKELLKNSYDKM